MRITGMATGMDTDATVKQMMKPYTMRMDKMKQDRQVVAWKQELYRDILSDTTTIKDTYFSNTKLDTNVLSKNNYAGFDVTAASSTVGESAGASATASVGAVAGNYKVVVTQLATTDKVDGAKITDTNTLTPNFNLNKYTTKLSDLKIADGETLQFDYTDSNGSKQTKILTVSEPTTPATSTISKDATISQLIDAVNKGTNGNVKLNFSELTKSFSIEGSQTGDKKESLVVAENALGGILTKLNLTVATGGVVTVGKNAELTITPPGTGVATPVTKSGNTFSIDGVNYTLTKEGTTNITVAGNSQKTYDKIKGFIDKYNELVDKVSQKTDEKKQYKYLPLTDEQRTAMKEDEIKQWETKAKVGLLKGDSNLDNMLTSMRRAFYDGVEGAGISLTEIGLSTSPVTSQRGKIIIDEKKLKTAIETKGEQVADLFAKQSTTYSSYNADATSNVRDKRNSEQGIFQRINDIMQDYTRTSRNNNNKKGILLEKAGIKGDQTETTSLLSADIIKKDKKISEMIKSLATRENSFYLKFSKLETAMNKLNSQSNWLTQQLGGGK
ncbi:flagellar filament capping protein FliD [Clostridium estertheticum]|uniref:flagellar filament capping protein FliD n=1 Tax=Clostridium estertheticum TaxID=238834 RepID=UPI00124C35F6|nr:flagellar filament capping protein FliD [Clostridium estertheticum]MBU3170216.1 flagellar filament capping protein FliD [Clostridium estertheticum]MBZ9617004.1 flagellar filament capping protein FliD [Clostridium estertheticum subsp. laramiense]WAG72705.1 flagellar filament capping protein FliD [Clostridium estertheticum]